MILFIGPNANAIEPVGGTVQSPIQHFARSLNWLLQLLWVPQLYLNPQHACGLTMKPMLGVLSNVSETEFLLLSANSIFVF